MHDTYTDQLDELASLLVAMCADVAESLDKATLALLENDLSLAQVVITEQPALSEARRRAENWATELLVLQAPVGTDLRIAALAIHAAADIERMGALACHVAEAVIRRHPSCALPDQIAHSLGEMGRISVTLAHQAIDVIELRDLDAAATLEVDDDATDDLHEYMFRHIIDRTWPYSIDAAVDAALLARFYERFADHAVSVAQRVTYVVTGKMPGHRPELDRHAT